MRPPSFDRGLVVYLAGEPSRRARRCCLLALCSVALGALAGSHAQAQVTADPAHPLPDPSKFARGLYVQAEAGALSFLGKARRPLGVGVLVGARAGYEVVRGIAFELAALGSTHSTDFAGGPQSDQLLQIYQGVAGVRLGIPFGRLTCGAVGSVGVGHLSTNLLETTPLARPGSQTMWVYGGGLGVDWHTLSRHLSFGATLQFTKFARVESTGALAGVAYLRHTF